MTQDGEPLAPIYGLESGGRSCLKAEDRAKKQDRRDRAEKEKWGVKDQ